MSNKRIRIHLSSEREKFEQMEVLIPEGFSQKDLTVGTGKANLYAFAFAIPLLLVFGFVYGLIWFRNPPQLSILEWVESYRSILWISPLLLFAILVGGVIVHEMIHGLTWALFARNGYRSISYGMMWKFLTPYCHCKEPLLLKHYLLGGMMPAVVLGFVPSVWGIVSGNLGVFLFGLMFTLAAGGDFLILWMLRNSPKDSLVQDHPDRIGCFVLEKNRAKQA